jgi:hypothetical protein
MYTNFVFAWQMQTDNLIVLFENESQYQVTIL